MQTAISPLLAAARSVRARLVELRPRGQPGPPPRDAARDLDPEEGRLLTGRNVHALRTLFNASLNNIYAIIVFFVVKVYVYICFLWQK